MADCYYHGQSFSGPCVQCATNRSAGRKDGDDGDYPKAQVVSGAALPAPVVATADATTKAQFSRYVQWCASNKEVPMPFSAFKFHAAVGVARQPDDTAELRAELDELQARFDEQNTAFHVTALKLKQAEENLARQPDEPSADFARRVFLNQNFDLSNSFAAPSSQAAPDWKECERISNLPAVDEALSNFSHDSTGDNATCIVRAIIESGAVSGSQAAPTEAEKE